MTTKAPSLTGDRNLPSDLNDNYINKMYIPLFGGIHPNYPDDANADDSRGEFFISQLRKVATFNKKEGEPYTAVRGYRIKTKKGEMIRPTTEEVLEASKQVILYSSPEEIEKRVQARVRDWDRARRSRQGESEELYEPEIPLMKEPQMPESHFKSTRGRYNRDEGNTQFKSILSWMYHQTDLYQEMITFICQFTERIGGKQLSNIYQVLPFITSIPLMPNKGERNFAIAVVQAFVKDLYIDGNPIFKETELIMNPDMWRSISDGLFFSKREIIANLFGDKGTNFVEHGISMNDDTVMETYRQAILKAQCDPNDRSIRFFTPHAMGKYLMKQIEGAINKVKEDDIKYASLHASKQTIASPNISSPYLDQIAKYDKSKKSVKKYRYIRKDKDKELYIITEDGTETPASDFTKEAMCQAIGMDPKDNIYCDNFLRDCINGRNIGACSHFLSTPTFWIRDLDNYLDNINLYLAHVALEQYKIPKEVRDGLVIYMDIDKWHTRLFHFAQSGQEGLDRNTVQNIIQNEALNAVIQGIIQQINATPTILNPSVVGEVIKEEAKASSPIFAFIRGTENQHSSWPKGRIAPGEIPAVVDAKMKELKGHYDAIYKLFKPMLHTIVGSPNIRKHPYMHNLLSRLGGGAGEIDNYNVQSTDFYSYYKRLENLIKMVETGVMPSWLHDTVRNYENLLKENGINIAEEDLKHLYTVIDGIKKLEKQVLFAIKGAAVFALVLNSDIGPVVKDLPHDNQAEHSRLGDLYALKNKTIDQMFKMLRIAKKKLDTYCSKTNKVGSLCSHLAELAP
jgi:hypothetical protein